MQLIVLYLATAVIFLAADAVMLRSVMKPLFDKHLGDMIRDDLNLAAAGVFYLFYVAGVLYLVSWAALQADRPLQALIGGAVLGAVAYGTYEFTSYAVMKNWSLQMVATDTIWGTVLTAGSAWGGVLIARALT